MLGRRMTKEWWGRYVLQKGEALDRIGAGRMAPPACLERGKLHGSERREGTEGYRVGCGVGGSRRTHRLDGLVRHHDRRGPRREHCSRALTKGVNRSRWWQGEVGRWRGRLWDADESRRPPHPDPSRPWRAGVVPRSSPSPAARPATDSSLNAGEDHSSESRAIARTLIAGFFLDGFAIPRSSSAALGEFSRDRRYGEFVALFERHLQFSGDVPGHV